MRFNNAEARLTLRANRILHSRDEVEAHLETEGVVTRRGRFAPDALIVVGGHPLRNPDRLSGWFVVQDEASQLVALLAGAAPGPRVLDACASPGGKTTALAAAVSHEAIVVASDLRDRRMKLLQSTVDSTGARNVVFVQADLERPLPYRDGSFDTVIVDAPCSGLGTLRRDPDIKWRRLEADLPVLAAAQQRMLAHAAGVVRQGGRLVYATCSSEPEENEDLIRIFLSSHPEFSIVHAAAAHPQLAEALVDEHGFLRTTPHQHQLEAFFGAVLVRRL
jgi:16S rRNA (cytosine967-C5)-methyltransferase